MKQEIRNMTLRTCAAVALICAAGSTVAENVHLGTDVASKEEIIQALMPSPGQVKTRGLRLQQQTETAPSASYDEQVEEVAAATVSAEPKSISLEVYFAFDSAALSEDAIQQLKPVGEALRSKQLETLAFELEGHTDASGAETYNLNLSERRAESVRQFFMSEFGIPSERLHSEGRGEYELLDPENPNSGINRRVKIIAN